MSECRISEGDFSGRRESHNMRLPLRNSLRLPRERGRKTTSGAPAAGAPLSFWRTCTRIHCAIVYESTARNGTTRLSPREGGAAWNDSMIPISGSYLANNMVMSLGHNLGEINRRRFQRRHGLLLVGDLTQRLRRRRKRDGLTAPRSAHESLSNVIPLPPRETLGFGDITIA